MGTNSLSHPQGAARCKKIPEHPQTLRYFESKALFDAACAGGIACGNGFVIAGKEDLVLFRRQVGTGGQVELFAVHVADVSLLRRAGGRRVGWVQLTVRHKALGAHGEVLAVAANGDGAPAGRCGRRPPLRPAECLTSPRGGGRTCCPCRRR